ncbi:MAG: hypothetical protein ACFFBD_28410, partial [Candidatus Hodarchaeota archaeon]
MQDLTIEWLLQSLILVIERLGNNFYKFLDDTIFGLILLHWTMIPEDLRNFLTLILLVINVVSGLMLAPYAFNTFFLATAAGEWKDPIPKKALTVFPQVTVQIPVYNESLV